MHIPDGMLDTKTFTTLWVGAGSGIGYASFWIRKHFDQKKIVLMAVLGALVFALQMLNFPIAGGTSGHFSGGALAGMLLGTWPAVIMMSAVLLIQAVFFGDGGITTLGANIVNMAIIAPLVGSVVFHLFNRRQSSPSRQIIGATLGAWLAVVSAALAVSLQLWAAGTAQFFAVLISMLFWHALIGVAEAVVTVSIIIYITRTRPDILADTQPIAQRSSAGPVMVLGVITGLAIGLSWLASSYPDGLEYVFNNNGGTLSGPAVGLFPGLLPGYLTP
ncbi:MAG: energy-coupling factor ABC transporter permease, partial [Actinomycetia bacterium]|nr:energy-coupling factor ABC transporter permease [Actinomycetes bacterium]